MGAAERIRQAGFELTVEDGALYVEPASRLTDQQRQFIHDHRDEIIAELTGQAANDDSDRLAMHPCPTCGNDTLHQRIEGQWWCTRQHPTWPRFDDSGRTGPVVECWTPAGGRVLIRAEDEAHAAWLRRTNPRPDSVTKSNEG